MEDDLVFHSYAIGLLQELSFPENSEEWRPINDASKISLKAFYSTIAIIIPECPSRAICFQEIKYYQCLWNIWADLKLVTMLTGL